MNHLALISIVLPAVALVGHNTGAVLIAGWSPQQVQRAQPPGAVRDWLAAGAPRCAGGRQGEQLAVPHKAGPWLVGILNSMRRAVLSLL